MRTKELAQEAMQLKKARKPGYRENVRLNDGSTVLCESAVESAFWQNYLPKKLAEEPHRFNIRELFETCVKDGREAVESWNPEFGGSGEVSMQAVRESDMVGYANFAKILGQFAYSQVMEGYQNEDFVFSKMIQSRPTRFQQGERIPGVARLGDQTGIVPEGGQYPRGGTTQDWLDTPATYKRGMIVEWSKELIYFAGTTQGEPIPIFERLQNVGLEMAYNKEVRIIDSLIDENTTTHRYNRLGRGAIATYGDNSGNHDFDNLQASNGLTDWRNIDSAQQLLFSMLDPNTGQPVALNMSNVNLVTSRALQVTANYVAKFSSMKVHAGGYATSGNLVETISGNPLVVDFSPVTSTLLSLRMATSTNWYYGDISKALTYLENWPITVVTRAAGSDDEFSRDSAGGVKVSEKGQSYVREPRYLVKCTA